MGQGWLCGLFAFFTAPSSAACACIWQGWWSRTASTQCFRFGYLRSSKPGSLCGFFLFSWKIGGGGLETPWMRRHTRPVWLTSMARWEEESFWFSLVHEQVAEEHWSQSLEDKALPSGSLNQVEELSIKWHNINPWEDRTVFFLFFTWAGKTDQDPTDQWLLVPPKPSGSPQNFTGFHLLIWN